MLGLKRQVILYGSANYHPSAQAYFAAMTTQPTEARAGLLNTLIAGLNSDGIWAKLDWFGVSAAHASQSVQVNAVTPSQALTPVSAPTFTTDRGISSDGAASYYNTGWNPTTASSPKFQRDSAHMGVWINTNVSSSAQTDIGAQWRSSIQARASANVQVYQNANVPQTTALPVATSVGHTCWTRSGASVVDLFKDGVSIGSGTTASSPLSNVPFFVCAINNAGSPAQFSTRRIAVFHWGAALNSTEVAALRGRLNTFLTAIGAAS